MNKKKGEDRQKTLAIVYLERSKSRIYMNLESGEGGEYLEILCIVRCSQWDAFASERVVV